MATIHIGLVDDHPVYRQGLAAVLGAEQSFAIAWEAGTADDAIEQAAEKAPEVIIMDVGLPGTSGISATREIVRKAPGSRILMLTMHARQEFVVQSLLAGATGFATKSQPTAEIVTAVKAVSEGKLYLAPEIPRTVLDEYHKRIRGVSTGVLDVLSKREKDVFELVVRNRSNRQIAKSLGISVKTVETHRMAINKKLAVHSSAELVRFAALHGLIHD